MNRSCTPGGSSSSSSPAPSPSNETNTSATAGDDTGDAGRIEGEGQQSQSSDRVGSTLDQRTRAILRSFPISRPEEKTSAEELVDEALAIVDRHPVIEKPPKKRKRDHPDDDTKKKADDTKKKDEDTKKK